MRVGSFQHPATNNSRALAASELRAARTRLVAAIAATKKSGDVEAGACAETALAATEDARDALKQPKFEGTD